MISGSLLVPEGFHWGFAWLQSQIWNQPLLLALRGDAIIAKTKAVKKNFHLKQVETACEDNLN